MISSLEFVCLTGISRYVVNCAKVVRASLGVCSVKVRKTQHLLFEVKHILEYRYKMNGDYC